jgi:type III secretion protein Q
VLTTESAALYNRFAQPREGAIIDLMGETLSLQILGTGLPDLDALRFPFHMDGRAGCLSLSSSLLARWSPIRDVADHLGRATPMQRCLVFEYFMLDILVAVERASQVSLRFNAEPVNGLGAEPVQLAVEITFEGDSQSFYAWLDLDLPSASLLYRLFSKSGPVKSNAFNALPMVIALHAGWQWLTAIELHNLQINDVVMLDHPRSGVRLVVQDCLWALVETDARGLRLISNLTPYSPHKDFPMEPVDARSPEPISTRLDQATVCIVCEVGRLELALSEVRTLGEGSVLALTKRPEVKVAVLANGQRIGEGELVRLGEGLGVRLTSLDSHE